MPAPELFIKKLTGETATFHISNHPFGVVITLDNPVTNNTLSFDKMIAECLRDWLIEQFPLPKQEITAEAVGEMSVTTVPKDGAGLVITGGNITINL